MKIIIEEQKLVNYLLIPKEKNDKSKFLNNLGFLLENWEELRAEILHIAEINKPVFQNKTPFGGELYEINGYLKERNSNHLAFKN